MFHQNDSIAVKQDVRDPDFEFEIGGWQGRIVEMHPAGNPDTVLIACARCPAG